MHRIKYSLAPLVALALVLVLSLAAFAASPTFTSITTSVDGNGNLVGNFTEKKVEPNTSISYSATGTEADVYNCSNGTQSKVVGPIHNAGLSLEPFISSGSFVSNGGGIVSAGVTIPHQPPPNSCKNPSLAAVSYYNLTITDDTNHVSAQAPPASRAF